MTMKAILYLHYFERNFDMRNFEPDFNLTEFEAGIWKTVWNRILVKGF